MKIIFIYILMSSLLILISGYNNLFEKTWGVTDVNQDDVFNYLIAPATPQNPRNSESAIVPLKDGSILLAWTEFYAGKTDDHAPAHITGRISTDGGRTFGDKYTLIENDGGCNVMEVNFLRLTNGELALFYLQKNAESSDCRVMMRTSSDEGKTWINPKQLSPSGKYVGMTNGRVIRLRSGRILVEAYGVRDSGHNVGGDCYCIISDDDGKTWRDSQYIRPAGGGASENTCIELKNGKVLMLMRTALGGQYKSISSDGGETWNEPAITPLTGTPAPAFLTRLPNNGDLLVIWNHNTDERKRNPLTSAISKDDGETWEHYRNIEDAPDGAWAYPAVTWIGNRALITYVYYKGGVSLKLRSLSKEWFYQ